MEKQRILIASGDNKSLTLLCGVLDQFNVDYVVTNDGGDAWYRYQDHTPHLVIIGEQLSGISPTLLCKMVNESPLPCPIIFLSTSKKAPENRHIDLFMTKPIHIPKFKQFLEHIGISYSASTSPKAKTTQSKVIPSVISVPQPAIHNTPDSTEHKLQPLQPVSIEVLQPIEMDTDQVISDELSKMPLFGTNSELDEILKSTLLAAVEDLSDTTETIDQGSDAFWSADYAVAQPVIDVSLSSVSKFKQQLDLDCKQVEEAHDDLFAILGLKSFAPPEMIRKQFHNYSKLYHPDSIPTQCPPEMVQQAKSLFQNLKKAYEKTYKAQRRALFEKQKSQQQTIEQSPKATKSAIPLKTSEATIIFHHGIKAIHMRQFATARRYIAQACELEPRNAQFLSYLGWAILRDHNEEDQQALSKANSCFQKAIKMDEKQSDALIGMGTVLTIANQFKLAQNYLNRYLAIKEKAPFAIQLQQSIENGQIKKHPLQRELIELREVLDV